jgi:hydrogenase maturation factor
VAAGLGLSVNDIILCVKLKKASNKQKKAIEAYKQSFDEEGNPIAAEIDKKILKDLDLNEDNAVSESTAKIKEELSSPEYGQTPTNESIDALLEAATKV